MQKWEYKIISGLTEGELNKLGEQGWELVATISSDSLYSFHLIFKRPKR